MKSPQISPLGIVSTSWKKSALAAAIVSALGVTFSPAAVIGYWRFENGGFLTDSGTNGLTLSTTANAPTQAAIPGSGATSDFFNPIPQTGASNGSTATMVANSSNAFTRADSAAFNVSTGGAFTIEAMANASALGSTRTIASQWANGQRSWNFSVMASGALQLQISSDGNSGTITSFVSGFTVVTGVDYYLAASFDISDTTTGVKFYFQDLTNGGALQTLSYAQSVTGIHNSTSAFSIGATNAGTSGFWGGNLDEVRFSNTALAQADLLAVPEPGAVALLGVTGLGWMIFRRRKSLPQ